MEPGRARVLDDFPFPVACPYARIFDAGQPASLRRWSLIFTQYQLLRTVSLPLVAQYLTEPIDDRAAAAVRKLNVALGDVRSPFFSSWMALVYSLAAHLAPLGIRPVFPGLGEALAALRERRERPLGLRGQRLLTPLDALLALRNETQGHGALANEEEAAGHLDAYLPVLHQVLEAFDFLGDAVLKVRYGPPTADGDTIPTRTLRGSQPGPVAEERLTPAWLAALATSEAALAGPDGSVVPLFPFFHPLLRHEPIYLSDGDSGPRGGRKANGDEGHVVYVGVQHKLLHPDTAAAVRRLFEARRLRSVKSVRQTALWAVAEAADLESRCHTLDFLIQSGKYLPACYVPFESLERHFERFAGVLPATAAAGTTSGAAYVNGLVLTGSAGAGKTAALARLAERLLGPEPDPANPAVVLYLHGDRLDVRGPDRTLFHVVAEKLGVAVPGDPVPTDDGVFTDFAGLLAHWTGATPTTGSPGRRLFLLLDALNEAPHLGQVLAEALDLVREAARGGAAPGVPACRTPWDQLHPDVRALLLKPLHLYLFMRGCNGELAAEVAGTGPGGGPGLPAGRPGPARRRPRRRRLRYPAPGGRRRGVQPGRGAGGGQPDQQAHPAGGRRQPLRLPDRRRVPAVPPSGPASPARGGRVRLLGRAGRAGGSVPRVRRGLRLSAARLAQGRCRGARGRPAGAIAGLAGPHGGGGPGRGGQRRQPGEPGVGGRPPAG
jgi:hypothetical protein